jgi:hypothetical protein
MKQITLINLKTCFQKHDLISKIIVIPLSLSLAKVVLHRINQKNYELYAYSMQTFYKGNAINSNKTFSFHKLIE